MRYEVLNETVVNLSEFRSHLSDAATFDAQLVLELDRLYVEWKEEGDFYFFLEEESEADMEKLRTSTDEIEFFKLLLGKESRGMALLIGREERRRSEEIEKKHREEEPERLAREKREGEKNMSRRTKTITLPGGAEMEMIYCAPGSFMMGSSEDEEDCDDVMHNVEDSFNRIDYDRIAADFYGQFTDSEFLGGMRPVMLVTACSGEGSLDDRFTECYSEIQKLVKFVVGRWLENGDFAKELSVALDRSFTAISKWQGVVGGEEVNVVNVFRLSLKKLGEESEKLVMDAASSIMGSVFAGAGLFSLISLFRKLCSGVGAAVSVMSIVTPFLRPETDVKEKMERIFDEKIEPLILKRFSEPEIRSTFEKVGKKLAYDYNFIILNAIMTYLKNQMQLICCDKESAARRIDVSAKTVQ